MPLMNGLKCAIEILKRCKNGKYQFIPYLIADTAYTDFETLKLLYEQGFSEILVMPIKFY